MKTLATHNIEDRLGCHGHFGFGGGWALFKGIKGHRGALYCNTCPEAESCFAAHKRRVASLLPDLTAEFEKRAQKVQGPELVKRWFDDFKCADPYTAVMGGNIEDGMSVAAAGKPKDRGQNTLPWPFKRQQ